jgi:heme/copper-type cytochrome/quinol oxidase subunit 1
VYAARWAKTAIAFMVIGVLLGIFMSATQKLELAPLHAHINLVGWASMGIFACLYKLFPALEESKLAPYHFWIYTVGFVLMMISLFFLLGGGGTSLQGLGERSIPITANITFLGVILALVTIWRNVKAPAKSAERQSKAS